MPLRAGAKPEYYDYIGIETPSQVICPEKLQEVGLQGLVISKDIASHLTGRPVAVNGCWEYVYRCERDMGEVQQAEWYMRDILISLANGMKLIGPGIFFDCASGYGNGLWGPIWGYLAFDEDLKTFLGAYFDHDSETPGLGAKIKDDPDFRAKFIGKIADFSQVPVFDIVKRGTKKDQPNAIDGISGATITTNGLRDAVNTWLIAYKPYFEK